MRNVPELFTQLPEFLFAAKLRLSKLNLLRGTQPANFPRAFLILCLVFGKVALVRHETHTQRDTRARFGVLLFREDARAYFVGSSAGALF